ncbi:DUF6064 family protein [Massilia niabensis]|uniref:DUF6064 family protein n=1 Tax=Massilia niabensis TaxID=544910 RepID=A0ABW0L112_9BURK
MSEWSTYSLSDLLMFSKATYFRLFELHNQALWPVQLAALSAGIVLLGCLLRGGDRAGRLVAVLLALAWIGVAWGYFAGRYATINTAAPYYAIAFAVQVGLLLWLASRRAAPRLTQPVGTLAKLALGIALLALVVYPLLAPLGGRPWTQAELFGLAPDPTVAFTFGALLLWRAGWMLWIVPLLWCAVTGATLTELGSRQAWVLPLTGLMALAIGLTASRRARLASR